MDFAIINEDKIVEDLFSNVMFPYPAHPFFINIWKQKLSQEQLHQYETLRKEFEISIDYDYSWIDEELKSFVDSGIRKRKSYGV